MEGARTRIHLRFPRDIQVFLRARALIRRSRFGFLAPVVTVCPYAGKKQKKLMTVHDRFAENCFRCMTRGDPTRSSRSVSDRVGLEKTARARFPGFNDTSWFYN